MPFIVCACKPSAKVFVQFSSCGQVKVDDETKLGDLSHLCPYANAHLGSSLGHGCGLYGEGGGHHGGALTIRRTQSHSSNDHRIQPLPAMKIHLDRASTTIWRKRGSVGEANLNPMTMDSPSDLGKVGLKK